jgi:hypothetical protein
MGIDWNGVVLSPLMDTFSITMFFTPLKSQPSQPGFWGRGVWEATPYTIIEENASPLTTTIYKIGLRLSEFTVPVIQGDQVTIDGDTYKLDTFEFDGQGGVRWVVKAAAAGQETQYGP